MIEVIPDKQPILLLEVPSVLEPNLSKTSSLPQFEACGVDVKPTKLLLLLKKRYCHNHQEPWSNGPLKDCTNSSTLLQHFSEPLSLPEQEKVGKGVIPDNTDASTRWALRNFNK